MNKSLIGGIIGGAALVTVGAVAGGSYYKDRGPEYADIVQVKTLRDEGRRPREECRDVEVVTKVEPKDKKQVTGTVVGAVVGGVLGHQIGSGKGNTAATVAGAAAGGYAGNRIQNNNQDKHEKRVVETRRECRTVSNVRSSEIVGYEVTYRLNGDYDKVVVDRKPRGDRILIENGRAVG